MSTSSVHVLSSREGTFCFPPKIAPGRSLRPLRFLRILALGLCLGLFLVSVGPIPGPSGAVRAEEAPPATATTEAAPDESDAEELIVVTATRLPRPVSAVPAPVTVVSREQAEAAGATTLGEALKAATPLAVAAQGGPGALISANLQGSSSSQVQVLIDGRPVDNGLAPVDLTQLSLAGVERIEVVQGPVSSLYGANALGGVINLLTSRPPTRPTSSVQLTLGGFGERKAAWSVGDGRGWGSYLLSGSVEAGDGWRPNSDSASSALSAKLVAPAPGGEVTFQFRRTESRSGVPGSTKLPTPSARGGDEALHLDVSYQSASDLTLRLYRSHEVLTYQDPAWAVDSRHEAAWSGLEGHRTLERGGHRTVLGGEVRFGSASSTNLSGHPEATNLGFYLEDTWRPSPASAWSWTFGGRLDAHSVYGSVLSPRFGAVRHLGGGRRLWLSVARAFRAPSFEDLYWQDPWSSGNPDLRPETATAFQAGTTWGDWEVSAFHKEAKDNIVWVTDPETWTTRVENFGATRFDGLEVTWRRRLSRWLTAQAAWSWLQPVDVSTGLRLPNRPAHRGSLALAAMLPGDWRADATLKGAGEYFADQANAIKVPGYAYLDLSVARAVNPNTEWQVRLENALNAAYQEVAGYPMPGATVAATVTYRF